MMLNPEDKYHPYFENIRKWAEWAAEPMDTELLAEVQAIFAPVKNVGHVEGRLDNN